jgi:hypothetical protein
MRVLVTGWPSFVHGEATAGDVLSMMQVASALAADGIPHDLAWSPVFRPDALTIDGADPRLYSHLVFACGPAHGQQVRELHERFSDCRRIAVGVSVIDDADPAVRGFHRVLIRDDERRSMRDLASGSGFRTVPVAGVVLAPGQPEYGWRRRHDELHTHLQRWISGQNCAWVPLDTRLDRSNWRHCTTGDEFLSLLSRLDAVLTTRLHGMVLALRAGVPALAVDPIAGTGKVAAQARALEWPACLDANATPDALDRWWRWCLSSEGRTRAAENDASPSPLLADLVTALRATP